MSKNKEIDKTFISIAKTISNLSTCISKQVGCVLTKDQRIISTGYNGTASKCKHCNEVFKDNFDREEHHKWSLKNEIHSEMNALAAAAKYGISTDGCTIYSTLQPCNDCLRNMCAFGIKRIVYEEAYDKCSYSQDVLTMLEKNNILLEKYGS